MEAVQNLDTPLWLYILDCIKQKLDDDGQRAVVDSVLAPVLQDPMS